MMGYIGLADSTHLSHTFVSSSIRMSDQMAHVQPRGLELIHKHPQAGSCGPP